MIRNPFVGAARIGWMEFWAHLKSPRLLILVVLLALLVFGASYGMSAFSGGGSLASQTNLTAYTAVRNESGVDHYLVIGWLADQRGVPLTGALVSFYAQEYSNATSGIPQEILLSTLETNASGFAVYDAGSTMPQNVSYRLQYGTYTNGYTGFRPGPTNVTFYMGLLSSSSYSGPSGTTSYFSVHAMTPDGYPAAGADIYLDDNLTGHLDQNGFFSGNLPEGQHFVKISYKGYEESYPIQGSSSTGPVYQNGADVVLMLLVGSFMGLVLPVMAIAVSFDAIARERAQGSLELLLARRVRREGIVAGKFLGAFASIALPVVGVMLGGIAVVTALSGQAPTPSFAAMAVGASLFLVAVYVLLMLLFSTLAKSVGTAVVFGVVTWLFFNVIFSFITVFMLFAAGANFLSPDFYSTVLTVYLFDPNLVYQLLLGSALPLSGGGISYGITSGGYLSLWTLALAAVLWIAVPLALTILLFRRKAES